MTRTFQGAVTMAREAMHVVARVGDERFAFRVIDVEEAIDAPALLRVPNAPRGLVGQFTHRERTVSAFDSGWMFDVQRRREKETALVLRVSDDRIALLVDDVEDLTGIDSAEVRAVPAGTDSSGLLRGIWLPRDLGPETGDWSFPVSRRETRGGETPVSSPKSLVCLVNPIAVMARGAAVVAPAMASAS